MIVLIQLGRLAMVAWALYSLLLIFVPGVVHHASDRIGGALQFVAAYAAGYLLDRLLGRVRRRRAARLEAAAPAADTGAL